MIFTDRSRWKKDSTCRRARFHEYHDGPAALGLRPRRQHIPLATGTAVHEPLAELLLASSVALGGLVPRETAREIVRKAIADYREAALADFIGEATEHSTYIVAEQACLIEGLFWCFWAELLPWLVDNFEIIEVEQDDAVVIECTCGVGAMVGGVDDHVGCGGVAQMVRPDFAARHRETGIVSTFDFKTSAYALDRRQHEHAPQMALSGIGLERRLGEQIPSYYLIGLLKGKRDFATKAEREAEGSLKKQSSLLCYAWYLPAAPGMKAVWRMEYTREKGFAKVPVWEAWFGQVLGEMSAAEYWALEVLGAAERKDQLDLLGPCDRDTGILGSLLKQIANREREVAAGLWEIADNAGARESVLDRVFPQNWNACFEYGRECEYRGACLGRAGALDGMVVRRPHHGDELRLAKSYGIVFEGQEEGEEA